MHSNQTATEHSRFQNLPKGLPYHTELSLNLLTLLDNVSTILLRYLLLNILTPHSIVRLIHEDSSETDDIDTMTFHKLVSIFKNLMLVLETRSPDNSVTLTVHDVTGGLWVPNQSAACIIKDDRLYITKSVRQINLVKYLLIALGCYDNLGIDALQNTFFDVFCPNTYFNKKERLYKNKNSNIISSQKHDLFVNEQIRKFLKTHGVLYLELKTQALILSLQQEQSHSDRIPTERMAVLLNKIFPKDELEIDRKEVSPAELEFSKKCVHRIQFLSNFTSLEELVKHYSWKDFMKNLLAFCNKNIGIIIMGRVGRDKNPLFDYSMEDFNSSIWSNNLSALTVVKLERDLNGKAKNALQQTHSTIRQEKSITNSKKTNTDSKALDLSESQKVMKVIESSILKQSTPTASKRGQMTSKELVDVALVVSAQSGVKKLKPKKNWTKEEEAVLKKGLEDIGPLWSKILDLYGPGGTVNEVLKNRTQVQLKDKARNWKLRYLKSKDPLPAYLSKVTGRIKEHTK